MEKKKRGVLWSIWKLPQVWMYKLWMWVPKRCFRKVLQLVSCKFIDLSSVSFNSTTMVYYNPSTKKKHYTNYFNCMMSSRCNPKKMPDEYCHQASAFFEGYFGSCAKCINRYDEPSKCSRCSNYVQRKKMIEESMKPKKSSSSSIVSNKG